MSRDPKTPAPATSRDATPLLSARNLTLRRGGEALLDDVGIDVGEREIVTVVGPNGGGKTTLVHVLLGLVRPDSGEVRRRKGLRLGYMPQRVAIDGTLPLTVRRFLALGPRVPPARLREAAGEAGASALLDAPVQRVSGGEMQRVLLARALLGDPDVLVLDEPAQSLDAQGQDEFYGLLAGLRERKGCAIVVVSHDLHLVMAAADRVVCLNRHVHCTGTPEEVGRHPGYLSLFPEHPTGALGGYVHRHPEPAAAGGARGG